ATGADRRGRRDVPRRGRRELGDDRRSCGRRGSHGLWGRSTLAFATIAPRGTRKGSDFLRAGVACTTQRRRARAKSKGSLLAARGRAAGGSARLGSPVSRVLPSVREPCLKGQPELTVGERSCPAVGVLDWN